MAQVLRTPRKQNGAGVAVGVAAIFALMGLIGCPRQLLRPIRRFRPRRECSLESGNRGIGFSRGSPMQSRL